MRSRANTFRVDRRRPEDRHRQHPQDDRGAVAFSFKRYEKYKDSGVEWLGEVPEHWTVTRLRHVTEINPPKSEVANLNREESVSFLPMEAIGDDGSISLERQNSLREVENGYTYFAKAM
jgi:hypothetical protein